MDLLYKNENKLFKIAAILSAIFWLVLVLGTVGIALLYLLLMYVFFIFIHSGFISYLKGTGVKITQDQFPDLHEKLIKSCKTVGLTEIPDAYLLRTDFFNALATRFLGRNFVVLFTDVVDALEEHPSAIDFYIGHEIGHIHRKHLLWGWFIAPACILPLLGSALRRAEEYTCDRYGAACCESEADIVAAIAAIAAGDTRWKNINVDAYIEQRVESRGFWMSLNELTSDYPWLTKRMHSAIMAKRGQQASQPRRHLLAWILSIFIPRLGTGAGSGIISLFITIAMVGILASVAMPQYKNYLEKTRYSLAYTMASQLQQPIVDFAVAQQAWPENLADIGYQEDALIDDINNFNVNIYNQGMIAAEVGVNAQGKEQYIVIEPSVDEGQISWSCYGENLNSKLLPAQCQ